MLQIGHLSVKSCLLSLMREHELRLLGFSSCRSLLNFALTIVEVFTLLIELALKIEHLTLFLLLDELKLLTEPLIELSFLLVPLVEVAGLTELVTRLQLQALGHVSLVAFERLNFLVKLVSISIDLLSLLLHTLRILRLQLLNHLRMSLLSVCFVVEVHLLLQFETLLELLLQLLKVSLGLVSLGLKELEASFP